MKPGLFALAAAVALATTVGCGGTPGSRVELTVLAAASLSDAFPDITDSFEQSHPALRVRLSFAGSQTLAAQVTQGAPADIIATADEPTMAGLGDRVRDVRVFAQNALTIAVAPGNPKRIGRLADLARPDVTVVLAAPAVPAGRYARTVLSSAGVTVRPASEEPDVRAALARVRLGEADAGIVYETDVRAAGEDISSVEIPEAHTVTAAYPAAVVANSQHPDEAGDFVGYLVGEDAQAILRSHGFRTPP